jgi:hypothetical protein
VWSFGDGTKLVTTESVTAHAYASPGTYKVALIVRDAAGTSTKQVFTGQTLSRNGGGTARVVHRISIT